MQGDDPINFAALSDALLGRAQQLCESWLPGGKVVGREYTVRSIWRHEKTASLRVCLSGENAGSWADFGGDTQHRGNDLVSLCAAVRGLSMAQAAVELAHEYGLQQVANVKAPRPGGTKAPPPPPPPPVDAKPRDKEEWDVITPVPATTPASKYWHFHHKEAPEHIARYQRDGLLYGFVVRWRTSDGGKDTLPHTWCTSRRDGASKWHWKVWPDRRPLYLPGGTSPAGRTVILVEGEKKADALHQLLEAAAPGVYCVASWAGGCKAWRKADWAWLAGALVLLWPDADAKRTPLTREEAGACADDAQRDAAQAAKPLLPAEKQGGTAAMLGIGATLAQEHGCTVQMLPIPAPGEVADGWDCADAIAEGWDAPRVLAFFGQAQPLAGAAGEGGSKGATVLRLVPKSEPPAGAGTGTSAGGSGGGGGSRGPGDAFDHYLDFINPNHHEIQINRKLVIASLRRAPALTGVLGFNELLNAPCTRKPWPWREQAGPLKDTDDLRLGDWLSDTYRVKAASRAALSEAIDTVADESRFHPIRDWLHTLQHDGTPRLDKWLIHALALDPAALAPRLRRYLEMVGRFWLLGMVARVMEPGVKFDYSLVLEGKTGRGKSTFFSTLAGKEHFSDTHFDIGQGKDGWEQLEGLWIYELSELTALRKADSEQVKAFFSSQVDRFRGAYGKYVQAHPRQCVIGCSTNKRQYLYDLTGNRRFWPVWVEQPIRLTWLAKWRGQLFAEALAAYRAGAPIAPTLDEEAEFFVPEQRKRLADTAVQSRLEYLLTREGVTLSEEQEGRKLEALAQRIASKELSVLTTFVTLDQLVAALGADPAKSTAQLEAQVRSWLEAHGWQAGRESTGLRRRGWRQPADWPPALDDDDALPAPAPSNQAPDPENIAGRDQESDHARSREPGEDDDLPF